MQISILLHFSIWSVLDEQHDFLLAETRYSSSISYCHGVNTTFANLRTDEKFYRIDRSAFSPEKSLTLPTTLEKWEWHSIWFQRKCMRRSRRFRYHTHYPGLSVHTGPAHYIIPISVEDILDWTSRGDLRRIQILGLAKPLYQRSLEGERLFSFQPD